MPDPSPRRRPWPVIALVLGLAMAVGVWYVWFRGTHPTPDPMKAAQANARGIGYLEQFDYPRAAAEFETAVKLAPDWTPAKINRGIALYNTARNVGDPVLDQAINIFREVLAGEPDNPYAHYNLGFIYEYRNDLPAAAPHFEAVTRIDPNDAHAWLHRGMTHPHKDDAAEAKEFFQTALTLNPYLNAARHQLSQHGHGFDADVSDRLRKELEDLKLANWEDEYGIRYTENGKYALAIGAPTAPSSLVGPVPMFEKADPGVTFPAAVRPAKDADLGAGPEGDLRRAVRERFGMALVQFDYDKDGKPDLFVPSAVVRDGKLSDLVLHNSGGTFTDATAAVGLAGHASLGCAVADFDNDGWPDLCLTGPDGAKLLRNEDGKRFADRTADAGLVGVKGVFLGAGWIDLDQDADLDLVVARYADTAEAAVAGLKGKPTGGGFQVFLNVGESPPGPPGAPPGPLSIKFLASEKLTGFTGARPATAAVFSDLEMDRDVDAVLLADGQAPAVVLNDRLLRFRAGDPVHDPAGNWNGGLVLDANGDEQSDLLFVPAGAKPVLLVTTTDALGVTTAGRFKPGATDSPPLVQGHTTDLDLDGRADVLGLSADRKPVFLQGTGTGKLDHKPGAFGPAADQVPNLAAVAACDFDGDCDLDLLTWSSDTGLGAFRSLGNGNRRVVLTLTGLRDKGSNLRTNADGVGALASALTGPLRAGVENTTLSAGLGQGRGPLTLGVGGAGSADVVRVRWPDGVPQAELNVRACEPTKIVELNRKGTSCPVLLTWDGNRFRYVTDFLGGGVLGEYGPDGSVRPPRPEESVKIEAGQLVPRNGRYVVKIAEPMDEVMYLDHLRLDVVDHPAGVEIHPDERFPTGGPAPTQELLALRDRFAPVRATDTRGRDVTSAVAARDAKTVDGFAHRSWLGFAEDHFVELDFADRLAGLDPAWKVYLVLAGWTDYPYPESIFAATQAGVAMRPPVVERRKWDGRWEPIDDLGFPAGLPKVMTRELPGLAGAKGLKLRVRTNLQIYWDQVYLAPTDPAPAVVSLPVTAARLAHRGFMQEVTPAGGPPIAYDDDRAEPVAVTRWQGTLTRTGDVTPLVTGHDDRFVLCGPGDEVTVEFDAAGLPPLKPGEVRSFVLRTYGYCKDTALFTKTGGQVGPLPYRGMASYPDGAADRGKAPAGQDAYDREWNTRPAGR